MRMIHSNKFDITFKQSRATHILTYTTEHKKEIDEIAEACLNYEALKVENEKLKEELEEQQSRVELISNKDFYIKITELKEENEKLKAEIQSLENIANQDCEKILKINRKCCETVAEKSKIRFQCDELKAENEKSKEEIKVWKNSHSAKENRISELIHQRDELVDAIRRYHNRDMGFGLYEFEDILEKYKEV